MEGIEILKIATALDTRYENLKCLSDDAKEQTWSLIRQQIGIDDWLKTNAQDDTDSANKTICETNEEFQADGVRLQHRRGRQKSF